MLRLFLCNGTNFSEDVTFKNDDNFYVYDRKIDVVEIYNFDDGSDALLAFDKNVCKSFINDITLNMTHTEKVTVDDIAANLNINVRLAYIFLSSCVYHNLLTSWNHEEEVDDNYFVRYEYYTNSKLLS